MSAWRCVSRPTVRDPIGKWERRIGVFRLTAGAINFIDAYSAVEFHRGPMSAVDIDCAWTKIRGRTAAVIARAQRKAEAMARKAGLAVPRG